MQHRINLSGFEAIERGSFQGQPRPLLSKLAALEGAAKTAIIKIHGLLLKIGLSQQAAQDVRILYHFLRQICNVRI